MNKTSAIKAIESKMIIPLVITGVLLLCIANRTFDGRSMRSIVEESTMKIKIGDSGFGSGWVYSDKYIVTAGHVVDSGQPIRLMMFGEEFLAEVIGYTDADGTDVGVIRIPLALRGHLKPLESDLSPLGYLDPIILVGASLGLHHGVTQGIISNPKIVLGGLADDWPIFAKTDAAANGGNSGGVALRNGKAVGILTRGIDHGMGHSYIVRMPVVEREVQKILERAGL